MAAQALLELLDGGPQLEYVRVSSIRERYGRSRFAVGRSGRSTGIEGSWSAARVEPRFG